MCFTQLTPENLIQCLIKIIEYVRRQPRAINRDRFRTDDYQETIHPERKAKKQYMKYFDEAACDKTACDINVFNVVDCVKEDQDVLFSAKDTVEHSTLNLYGTIENLFEINGVQWADCSFRSEHDTENISNIIKKNIWYRYYSKDIAMGGRAFSRFVIFFF